MNGLYLLPRRWKIAGWLLIVLSFVVPVAMGILQLLPQLGAWKQEIAKTVFLLGLFLLAFTREQAEDEFIASCRLKSMFTAFAVSMVYYLAQALLPILQLQPFSYSGFMVLSFQLFTYLIYFHIAIRGGVFNHAE